MVSRSMQKLVNSISFSRNSAAFLLVLLAFRPDIAKADLITYSSRSAFDTAAGSPVSLVDFEPFPVANVNSGSPLGGVTFNYFFGNVILKVINSLPATSGTKSLGSNDRDL